MKNINGIDQNVLEAFKHYPWPGNIRELENVMERAYILETGPILSQESFPGELLEFGQPFTVSAVDPSRTLAEERRKGIEIIERNYLKELLVNNRGKIKESAQAAGITPRQLHKLMSKYGFRKEKFKSAGTSTSCALISTGFQVLKQTCKIFKKNSKRIFQSPLRPSSSCLFRVS